MEQPIKGLRIDCSLGGAAPILKRNPELEDVQRRVCLLGVLTHTRGEHQIIERERDRQTDRAVLAPRRTPQEQRQVHKESERAKK